ncbi:MAG: DUF1343 domain-containing protein [Cyclobacteriaceae bacterium]|nr:DUF1343 domain-containing protein [Cyclobacteriaceae bacterium]
MKRFVLLILLITSTLSCKAQGKVSTKIVVGAAQFNNYLSLLKNKNIALVVNQTSMVSNTHLVDTLLAQGVSIKKIFAPEHGFRGNADAGEHVENGIDVKTQLPIISLYGKHRKPTKEDLSNIDIVVFDIQDVGVRFYTYISTMHYVMEACAEQNKKFIILDRPNPNGQYIAGPVLDLAFQSFVGMHPIPIVHGLTVGELAQMINGEGWLTNGIQCNLGVIKLVGYTHHSTYELPIKPSPNLPNQRSILLYPSLCLLEPSIMSIGRGTTFPFQVIGFPDSSYGKFSFAPISIEGASKYPKHENKKCFGEDLRELPVDTQFTIKWLLEYYRKSPSDSFFTSPDFFDKLVGNSTLRSQLKKGLSAQEIEKSWRAELEDYKNMSSKYRIYSYD